MPSTKEGDRSTLGQEPLSRKHKLGVVSGVYIPVCLNIISILMFLRFGRILGQIGLLGMLALLIVAYTIDFVTTLSLSAIASNGEVKGGGAYYLISRSLGPEFGGSIGILFYLAQVLNTALNVVGLIDCLKLNIGAAMPHSFWKEYLIETVALVLCTALCLAGSGIFAKASNALLVVLTISILSIPLSVFFVAPFRDEHKGIDFTGFSLDTLRANFWPHTVGREYRGAETFRELFGILFPATSGIFAGASMSGDLRNPSKDIPLGTLWAMLSTFIAYVLVIMSLATSTKHSTFLHDTNVLQDINVWGPLIFAGECATTFFSALMGLIGSAKLLQALSRDKLLPGLSIFGRGTKKADEPVLAILLTYGVAQFALFANLNQIATFISMGYQMTFFVMNLACFFLKIGSAPNFRPSFKFFTWQTAFVGSILSAAAMFFIDETYASTAVCLLIFLFLLIHYLSPPKHWGDVSQNLIYHQVRKYLLRLKPEHIKFWRPQILLLINNPRKHIRLVQFCNSMKKGGLYILGHVIVTDDFSTGVHEAKTQQAAWTRYITEYSRIKAFMQLTMSPTITWGIRNLILSSGLGGLRPNIAVLGFYNMEELRNSQAGIDVPGMPAAANQAGLKGNDGKPYRRRRGDTTARLVEGSLPTDVIRTEGMMDVKSYMTILEDLALRYRLNVAVGKGFDDLEPPRKDGHNAKRYIDLWPIQMSLEVEEEGLPKVLASNFDTYTAILQLGFILHSVPAWKKAYKLRILVFVEYENEVEVERQRVQALLEKLRIEAELHVFWLACGELSTYEMIIHGRTNNPDTVTAVNSCLENNDWWAELQSIRGFREMTASREPTSTTNVLDATSGRAGRHAFDVTPDQTSERDMRRHSVAVLADLPKKQTISRLAQLGINMGMRAQNLPALSNVFDNSDAESASDSDSEMDVSELNQGDFNDAASEGDLEDVGTLRRPLLQIRSRSKSHGEILTRSHIHTSLKKRTGESKGKTLEDWRTTSYGAIAPPASHDDGQGFSDPFMAQIPTRPTTKEGSPDRSTSERGTVRPALGPDQASKPERPSVTRVHSRHASSAIKFSSNLTPEMRITEEDGSEPRIMFAHSDSSRSERPGLARHSSTGRILSTLAEKQGEPSRTVSFASLHEARSEHGATIGDTGQGDAQVDIGNIRASYSFDRADDDGGSSYSTQGLPLSFNDLPSRAQHLILNELLRQNSQDTAVLYTTLPIPQEGTCQSEEDSIHYLSDIEVLCDNLPPVLLVLSNNATVTVGL